MDGLQTQCKACKAIHSCVLYRANRREILARHREYDRLHLHEQAAYQRASRLRWPLRHKARQVVNDAIRSGRLIRPDRCSNPECDIKCKPEAHHHNGYDEEHWLDVIFLCKDCHAEADNLRASV